MTRGTASIAGICNRGLGWDSRFAFIPRSNSAGPLSEPFSAKLDRVCTHNFYG